MSDNFDFKNFLIENKLGAYSKAKINENTVVASGDNRWTVDIDGMEYQAEYENHDEGDHIELRRVGNPKDIKSGTVKNVSEDGDITIELDSTNDYAERRKAIELTEEEHDFVSDYRRGAVNRPLTSYEKSLVGGGGSSFFSKPTHPTTSFLNQVAAKVTDQEMSAATTPSELLKVVKDKGFQIDRDKAKAVLAKFWYGKGRK